MALQHFFSSDCSLIYINSKVLTVASPTATAATVSAMVTLMMLSFISADRGILLWLERDGRAALAKQHDWQSRLCRIAHERL